MNQPIPCAKGHRKADVKVGADWFCAHCAGRIVIERIEQDKRPAVLPAKEDRDGRRASRP